MNQQVKDEKLRRAIPISGDIDMSSIPLALCSNGIGKGRSRKGADEKRTNMHIYESLGIQMSML